MQGILNEEGQKIEMDKAISNHLKQVYCPKRGMVGGLVVENLAHLRIYDRLLYDKKEFISSLNKLSY